MKIILTLAALALLPATQCKAAWVGIAAMVAWRVSWWMPHVRDRLFCLLACAVIGVIVVWCKYGATNSLQCRVSYARNAIYAIAQRPVGGYGIGTCGAVYYAYHEPVCQSITGRQGKWPRRLHNDWLQAAVECGIPYAIGMMLMAGWWCVQAARRGDWPVSMALVGLCVVAAMDFPLQVPVQAALFWMLGGITNRKGQYEDLHCRTDARNQVL